MSLNVVERQRWSLAGCTLLLSYATLLIPAGAKRLWAATYQACSCQRHQGLQCRSDTEGNQELNDVFPLDFHKGERVLPNHLCSCGCSGPLSKDNIFGYCFFSLLLHCRKMENGWNRIAEQTLSYNISFLVMVGGGQCADGISSEQTENTSFS